MIIDVNGNISDGGMLDFWLDNGSQGNIADLRELDEYFHIIYYTNDTEKRAMIVRAAPMKGCVRNWRVASAAKHICCHVVIN